MSAKKKIIIPVVIIAAAAVVLFFVFKGPKGEKSTVFVQSVRSVSSSAGALLNRFGGVVETQKTEKTEFDTTMTLAECFVKEGDRVKEGDPLFSYDTATIDLKIQQTEIEIERFDAGIADANTQIAELEKLIASASSVDKVGYTAQISQLRANISQAEYDKKTKNAEIEKLKASLEKTTVKASMAGTVKSIADISSILAGTKTGPDGMPDNTYITIVADGDFRINGTITEQNIGEIYEEMRVIVRSRVDDTFWKGRITVIDTQAKTGDEMMYYSSGENASKYSFYVDLDETNGLMLGQHVTIEPDFGQTDGKDGVWLTSGWIVRDGSSAYVWVSASPGEKLEKRGVALGEYNEETDEYKIEEGLVLSEYIAWPDSDCTAGALTTTEIMAPSADEGFEDMEYEGEGSYEEMPVEEGAYEEMPIEEGAYEEMPIEEGAYEIMPEGGTKEAPSAEKEG